ncbi:neuronal acetylcholine receptor subunit beta-3 [Culex quinquefasciatus]|uniref:neuronal acetylcholine receptor subunit beta-3 n=1 Tax=Culex quinquefasciatus TaxID=7176 RepID=UPI0018E3EE61|nr:neuronal acetylcholine receptor subunit beta-3 [Culex quinquefasciatus]
METVTTIQISFSCVEIVEVHICLLLISVEMKYLLFFLAAASLFEGNASYKCEVDPGTTDARLRKKLFCGKYDKSERPVKNHNSPITVYAHMDLQNFDFNESLQKLFLNVWFALRWKDEYLTWNAMEFDKIEQIVIDSEDIWLPDLMPYSSYFSNNLDTSCTTPKCQLESDGTVKCVPACEYHSICESDFTNWPFDRANCTLRFGMWVEDSNQVNFVVNSTNAGANDVNTHNQWKIVASGVKTHDTKMPSPTNENTTYPTIVYNYVLERHSGSHCASLLAPAFAIISINFISMWLNCERRERLFMLAGSIFIHFTFIENLYWQIPYNGATVPSFLIFFRDSLVLTVLLMASTIMVKHLSLKTVEPPAVVSGFVVVLTANQLGQMIFGQGGSISSEPTPKNGHLNNAPAEDNSGDTVVLVGEDRLDSDAGGSKKSVGNSGAYKMIAHVVDKCLYIGIVVTYTLMVLALIPKYYK